MNDLSLEYWVDVARGGFEDDFFRLLDKEDLSQSALAERYGRSEAYVSGFINGSKGANPTIQTMVRWARALGAVLHIRMVGDGEVLRVVDGETARKLDTAKREAATQGKEPTTPRFQLTSAQPSEGAKVLSFPASGAQASDTSDTSLRINIASPTAVAAGKFG